MKLILTLAAAGLAATVAVAQTGSAPTTSGPSQSMTQPADTAGTAPSTTMSPSSGTSGSDASMAGMNHGSGGMAQTNGKWMMGDRPATKAEIKAHKQMMKDQAK